MHVHMSHQSQCGLYQTTNQIACQKITWQLHLFGDVSDYCSLFSQTFYGLVFNMTDVTSHVHYKFPVSFLLYTTTKIACRINQIITVNSSMNAPISETSQKKKLLHALRAYVFSCSLERKSTYCKRCRSPGMHIGYFFQRAIPVTKDRNHVYL